jgi:hypothetical protein
MTRLSVITYMFYLTGTFKWSEEETLKVKTDFKKWIDLKKGSCLPNKFLAWNKLYQQI